MTLRLYADECVDASIVSGVRRRGVDVVTAAEEQLLGAADEAHLDRARALGRVVVSCDQDFLRLAHHRAASGAGHRGLLYILPQTDVGDAVRAIVLLAQTKTTEELDGWVEWIP